MEFSSARRGAIRRRGRNACRWHHRASRPVLGSGRVRSRRVAGARSRDRVRAGQVAPGRSVAVSRGRRSVGIRAGPFLAPPSGRPERRESPAISRSSRRSGRGVGRFRSDSHQPSVVRGTSCRRVFLPRARSCFDIPTSPTQRRIVCRGPYWGACISGKFRPASRCLRISIAIRRTSIVCSRCGLLRRRASHRANLACCACAHRLQRKLRSLGNIRERPGLKPRSARNTPNCRGKVSSRAASYVCGDGSSRLRQAHSRIRTVRAGTPTAMPRSGTSVRTTAFAPTTAPSPI